MKIYYFEPKSCGIAYSVLAETKEEAMNYIHEYTYQKAFTNPFGLSNEGHHFITGDMEEFIKWRFVPYKLEEYEMKIYEFGEVLVTSIE